MSGPLSGLKVLDFSTLLPGPFATMMFADMGADVLRVESPSRPDMVRVMPPYADDGNSAAHGFLNRSKRSIAIDLKRPEGVEIVKQLIAEYDIVIEQFRPGVMDRLGVGYEALKAINPKLIYCSITGYGQTGPYRDRAGHDMNYLAIAGVLGYNGRKASGPAPMAVQVADVAGGSCHAVIGVLAAVIHRASTGQGQYIDISMTDAAFSLHALTAPSALMGHDQPALEATQLNGGTFYDCYETADGRHFSVGGLEPQFFMQFCAAIGRPELAPQGLNMMPDVVAALKTEIRQEMKKKTYAEWQDIFLAIDSCTEPVLRFDEAINHPHIVARELLVDVPQSNGGQQRQLASPIKFSATPAQYAHTGASLGEHTEQVLTALGYDEEKIKACRSAGVIA
ncbi:MAG: CaiB/BaiF CoA-transferase family protein [Moraxellaceae bacterium]|nr:CaiB/BaiF CoA-transferase family protein [Moraxellaceae bacterium]MDP1776363.1 CaiB/BaiF CoA-transferase family protein [Moraxellaceae bacterium]MDZ4297323.1 CaiB/BaiF CoA-transferase family protein [Moraxellaceae bacterium]MDZ4387136.1 CaiB/BaiF CoA-transferase family protein [Moraxellaceae bacterium]